MLRFAAVEIAPKCVPAAIVFLSSCADERPPTGGRKDSIPPKLKYADPANKSLNFNSKVIKLHFSEFIQQSLDPKEILISPPLDKKPKITVDGKVATIMLKSPLKANTTYTINFGDAVRDLNEGNILKNFTYVFATGSMLDTAKLSGTVINIADPKDLDDLIISLYPVDSIDGILHSKPFYFSKADKAGNFTINNIHAGSYRVYGLKDLNLNYIYDLSDELIGFSDSSITLQDSSKAKINLKVFLSENSRPKFIDAISTAPGKVVINYNSAVKDIKINSDVASDKDVIEINSKNDSITYWYSNNYNKKMHLNLTVNDSINDSTTIDLKTFNKDSTNNANKYSLSIESQVIKRDSTGKSFYIKPIISPFKPIIFNLSRPVDSIAKNKSVYVASDSTSKRDTVAYILSPKNKRTLTVEFLQKEKTPYTLVIPDSTFMDIFGWWNKKIIYKWTSDANDNYGTIILKIKIEHPEKHYVFKILDFDNKPIETYYLQDATEKKITIQHVRSGSYHLQAVEDINDNGEWDSGDFIKKLQPEKIINFQETYEVKGNWELEIEVKL
jgi:hypothetical protein